MMDHRKDGLALTSMQKTIYILLPLLIYFVVHDAEQLLLTILFSKCIVKTGAAYIWFIAHTETASTVIWAIALVAAAASVIPFIKRDGIISADYHAHGAFNDLRNKGQWCVLIVFAASISLGLNMLLQLTGIAASSEEYTQTAVRQYGIAIGLGIALYGILSPVIEEIIFRGILYNRMKIYFPLKLSIIVSSLLFGVYHQNIVQGIYAFIMGIFLTAAYEYFDSFTAPLIIHITANCLIYILSYFRTLDAICSVPACIVSLFIAAMCVFVLKKTAR